MVTASHKERRRGRNAESVLEGEIKIPDKVVICHLKPFSNHK
jgi:hypothetical protein